MARARRKARPKKNPLRPEERAVLRGEPCPEGGNRFTHLMLCRENLASVWERWGSELLDEWVAEEPGTRPAGWWWYSAPDAIQGDPPSLELQPRLLWDRDLLESEERKAVEKLGLLDQVEVVQGPSSGGVTA